MPLAGWQHIAETSSCNVDVGAGIMAGCRSTCSRAYQNQACLAEQLGRSKVEDVLLKRTAHLIWFLMGAMQR
jgi:hypothetical protein